MKHNQIASIALSFTLISCGKNVSNGNSNPGKNPSNSQSFEQLCDDWWTFATNFQYIDGFESVTKTTEYHSRTDNNVRYKYSAFERLDEDTYLSYWSSEFSLADLQRKDSIEASLITKQQSCEEARNLLEQPEHELSKVVNDQDVNVFINLEPANAIKIGDSVFDPIFLVIDDDEGFVSQESYKYLSASKKVDVGPTSPVFLTGSYISWNHTLRNKRYFQHEGQVLLKWDEEVIELNLPEGY
ncbi:MAG: hypothetical protein HRU19_11560 [Pseudobacteriovorax sp.]|nr:hypothetical protein [Pseudobacteriovorax sp.]